MEQGTNLARLLTRIRDLDQDICRFARLESRMLPLDDFVKILDRLADERPAILSNDDGARSEAQGLSLSVLRSLKNTPSSQGQVPLLSIYQSGLLQATEHIFKHLEYASDIDPTVYRLVNHLQVDLTRLLARDNEFFSDPGHPMRRFCEILLRICRLFDAYSGSRSEQLLQEVAVIVETLDTSESSQGGNVEACIDALVEVFEQHNAESLELARKLIAGEQGACLQENARQLVNREMFHAVEGLRLPPVFVHFLERAWSKYLYVTYLRNGSESRNWTTGIRVIRLLANSLHIRGRDTMFHYYGSQIPAALRTLKDAAYSIHQDVDLVENLLAELDDIHQRILNEEQLDISDWVEVHSANPVNSSKTVPEPSPQIESLLVGHWYKLNQGGLKRRCKLIEKNLQYGYCLFTNLSGILAAKLSFVEAEHILGKAGLQRMDAIPALENGLTYCTRELHKQLPGLERQVKEAEQAWLDANRRQKKQEAAELIRRHEEQRRQKEEARRQEQLRLEEERRLAKAEAEAEEQQAARRRLVDQAQAKLARMQSGGWLELIRDDQTRVSCKLGLRLKSSGKMIFVDSLGRKVAELHSQELAEKIVDGSASILDYGVAFDSTLSGLINERSEKIHRDEPE